MKKALFIFFVLVTGTFAFCQSSWHHSTGLSLNPAFYSLNEREDGTKNLFIPRASARYYGEHENSFCVSGTIDAGCALSSDITLQGEDQLSTGLALGVSCGAGYAFHPLERLTVCALGSLALDWERFSFKKEIAASLSTGKAKSKWTETDDILTLSIGAELLSFWKCTDRLSLFASCAVRFIDAGAIWINGTNQGQDYDSTSEIRGSVTASPSFGVAWNF